MEVKVKLNNLRTAPRKTRLVADLVRGKNLLEAQNILSFTVNKSARDFLKLLNSAAASAKNDFHLNDSNLFVSKITVDEGPKLKRWHPMSRGRAYPIIKRTSKITLVLGEINPEVKEVKKPDKSPKGHFDGPATISPKASLGREAKKAKKPAVRKTKKVK